MEKTKVGIVYEEIIEAIKLLPLEMEAKIYNALFEYQFKGEIKSDDLFVKSFILSHKTHLDNIIKRRKTNVENGNKGGCPKGSHNNPYGRKGKKELTETNQELTETNQELTLNKKQEIKNKKQEINNKKENNIKEKSLAVVKPTAHTEQGEVFNYFAKLYKQETNIDYLGKGIDYINLAKLIKKYGKALVIQKINWLLVGCKHSVFFFSKDMTDFNISTLTAQWDRILPKLTDQQKKEIEKKRKEEELIKQVDDELARQEMILKGGVNVRN